MIFPVRAKMYADIQKENKELYDYLHENILIMRQRKTAFELYPCLMFEKHLITGLSEETRLLYKRLRIRLWAGLAILILLIVLFNPGMRMPRF